MTIPENVFFDLVTREYDSVIYCCDKPLLTPGGHELCHNNERLLKHIMTDLLIIPGDIDGISSISLLEYQIDYLDCGNDLVLEHFSELSYPDPFYLLKSGKSPGKTIKDNHSVKEEFSDFTVGLTFWTVSSILRILNNFISENLHLAEVMEETDEPVLLLMRQFYNQASPGKKAAVSVLWAHHQPGLVLPFLLVSGLITPAEYAKGVVALAAGKQIPALPEEEVMSKFIPFLHKINVPDDIRQFYEHIYKDAMAVNDYLCVMEKKSSIEQRMDDWLKSGESAGVEFKSTLRWDLKQGKTNPSVERACLKTICGFLNTNGGTLLIGIRDDGSVEGIESDKFANEDKFLLHLWTLIRTCLGRDVSPNIQTILEKKDDKTVCLVTCSPSVRPIFLRQPGFDEEFYIRLGPGSAAMDISEALKYIGDRFRD